MIGIAALACLAALAGPARADFYLHPWELFRGEEDRPHLIPQLRYYSSSSNFDSSGTAVPPGSLTSYTRLEVDTSFVYAFDARWTAYARATWASASLNQGTGSNSVFGLADQTVGASYRLFPNPATTPGSQLDVQPPVTSLDLQLQVDFPAYSTAIQANNLPAIGDGSLDVTLGGFLTLPLSRPWGGSLKAVGGAGFTYRTGGFSAALPWSAWLAFEPREQGFLAGLGGSGFFSLSTDSNSSAPGAPSSGSFITGAVNPALLQASGRLGYRFSGGTSVSATGTEALWGQNAPRGFLATLTVDIPFGSARKETPPQALVPPKKYGAANQGFVTYSLDGHVQRVSDRINQLRIDKGTQQGVAVGQVFDIFIVKPDGTAGESVARCKVTSVKTEEANLSILEYFRQVWIEEGFLARRLVQ